MRRGVCTFADKALFVQQAGAIGAFMANDGRCGDYLGDDDCIIYGLTAADMAPLLSMPIVLVSQRDGEDVIAAIDGGATVRGMMGAVESPGFVLDANIWLEGDEDDVDPSNDYTRTAFLWWIFATDFETGDTSEWSAAVP